MEKRIETVPRAQPAMYCNNCGARGHLFRSCTEPVLSCGLILTESSNLPTQSATARLLMIRRKDSMSFAEFMRGKYDPDNTDYVGRLIGNMTRSEQQMVADSPFDVIWKSIWGDEHLNGDYLPSQTKFNQLDRPVLVANNPSAYDEPEWGFPKGRRIRGESDVDCAIREFNEETNVPRDAYIVLKNIRLEETFEGLNGIIYRHIYFVALMKHVDMINLNQRFTPMQRREISGIAWKTFDECEHHVRPHHVQRLAMIQELRSVVETFET